MESSLLVFAVIATLVLLAVATLYLMTLQKTSTDTSKSLTKRLGNAISNIFACFPIQSEKCFDDKVTP